MSKIIFPTIFPQVFKGHLSHLRLRSHDWMRLHGSAAAAPQRVVALPDFGQLLDAQQLQGALRGENSTRIGADGMGYFMGKVEENHRITIMGFSVYHGIIVVS